MKLNRWFYGAVGTAVLLLEGLVYAWSVLSLPLSAYFTHWTNAQLSLTFTICMMCFCFGCMTGGMISGKMKVKYHVWISGAIFFLGFFIASRANSPAVLYLGYGGFCGFGSGFVYNAALSAMSAWFPHRQGLISGIPLMGFGLSSFIVGKIYQAVPPSGEGMEYWRASFLGFGMILLAALFICGFFFVKPTGEELEARGISASLKKKEDRDGLDITAREMVARPSFWLFFL